MSVYIPSDDAFINPQTQFSGDIKCEIPLVWNTEEKFMSINDASQTSSGALTTGVQSFGGVKTFVARPKASSALTGDTSELATINDVNNLVTRGVTWLEQVIGFWDFNTPPVAPPNGSRYIAISTVGSFDQNDIYEYQSGSWVEVPIVEGMACYITSDTDPYFPNQCVVYSVNGGIGAWVSIGSANLKWTSISGRPNLSPSGDDVIVNGTTQSTDTATGSLQVKGGMSVIKNIYTSGIVNVTNTTNTTNSITGALLVSGGAGISGNLGIGGGMFVGANINLNGGILKANDTTQSINTTSGSVVVAGGIGVVKDAYLGGIVNIVNTTDATNTATGGFVLSGGAGIAKALFVGSTTDSAATNSGALVVAGGLGVAKQLRVGTTLNVAGSSTFAAISATTIGGSGVMTLSGTSSSHVVAGTTDATDQLTGAVKIAGGVGIAKALFVGTKLGLTNATSSHTISSTTDATDILTGALNIAGGLGVRKALYVGGITNLTNTTQSTVSNNGALVVSGGAGIGGNIYGGGVLNVTGNTTLGGQMFLSNVSSSHSIASTTQSTNTLTGAVAIAGGLGVGRAFYLGGVMTLSNTGVTHAISSSLNATDTQTGALSIIGGASVGGSMYIGGTTQATSTSTGGMVLSGGLGVAKNAYLGGLFLPTASGTAANLNYYQEYAATVSLGGVITTSVNLNIYRCGKLCVCMIGSGLGTASGSGAITLTNANFGTPSVGPFHGWCYVRNNGGDTQGSFTLSNTVLTFYSNQTFSGTFTNNTSVGIQSCMFSFCFS